MKAFVGKQTAKLVSKLGEEIQKADQSPDADAIHDLRVATRRLSNCLKIFRQFFPGGAAKKVRKHLKEHMDLAGEIRNRDIAMELLERSNVPGASDLIAALQAERRAAEQKLGKLLARLSRQRIHKDWRRQLETDK